LLAKLAHPAPPAAGRCSQNIPFFPGFRRYAPASRSACGGAVLTEHPVLSGIPSLRAGIPLRLRRGGAKEIQRKKFKRA